MGVALSCKKDAHGVLNLRGLSDSNVKTARVNALKVVGWYNNCVHAKFCSLRNALFDTAYRSYLSRETHFTCKTDLTWYRHVDVGR